jgi:hypothetical protein
MGDPKLHKRCLLTACSPWTPMISIEFGPKEKISSPSLDLLHRGRALSI